MKMLKATYNDKTFTRKTARAYTHAVACTLGPSRSYPGEKCIVAWCGSAELAAKAFRKYSAPQFGFSHLQIVEVHE